jgi:hypothetical protein
MLRHILKISFLGLMNIMLINNSFADPTCACDTQYMLGPVMPSAHKIAGLEIDSVIKKMAKEDEERPAQKAKSMQLKSTTTGVLVDVGILLGGLAVTHGHKKCIMGPLHSMNKNGHLAGNALITATVAEITDREDVAVGAALTASFIREAYKTYTPGLHCEWASMLYDAAGIVTGDLIGRTVALEQKDDGGFQFVLRKKFK